MLQLSLVILSVEHSLSVLLVADVEAWPGMIAVIPSSGGLRHKDGGHEASLGLCGLKKAQMNRVGAVIYFSIGSYLLL